MKLLLGAIFLILLAKVTTVMVFSGEYFRELSLGNRTKEEKIVANRGVIYDRSGKVLAQNLPQFILGEKIISQEEASLGKEVKVESRRSYPLGKIFAHVVGYVNLSEGRGMTGLEKEFDEQLKGKDGKELWETDANGKKLRLLGKQLPVAGENLTTALEANLQETLFNSLNSLNSSRGLAGAAVATNPQTGEVLALVSTPSFDPHNVEMSLDHPGKPFFNRAVAATYPPGSTFKIVTAAAGLENGVITRATKFEDTGVLVIGPYKFANWKYLRNGGVDGWINVVEALQKSNDVFFYQLGGKLGVEKLTEMAKKFGLGEPGIIRREREWFLGDTYHMAIGQGDLLVTPMQVNNWTRAIANGGKDLNLKKETVEIVKEGMKAACSEGGTAYPLFGMNVACKTGTAEFGDPRNRTHAWLTAFAPVDNPIIAITVLVEGGGEGSDVAAPIVKKALEEWFR